MIRTRFAPSPTGFMHVGGVRTALFAWAFARNQGGKFILRIEDTDKAREVEGSIDHIVESLDWLGLDRDEGPKAGGDYGPYLQSERLEHYKKYAQQLIDAGLAYSDPFSEAEIAEFRQNAKDAKRPFLYRSHRPEELTSNDDWYGKTALRFKIDPIERKTWQDAVRGELSGGEDALDDFVIIKADGYPTYNFAHIIDDHEMEISHVIRGEEFIASMPKFIALYQALGFDLPVFVTAPPILNANGGKKLSKRDGARDVLEYRDDGYLPEAINNFLASMGWNDGTEDEVFTLDEIKQRFALERIQKSGAKFDETKLDWLQWQHVRARLETNPLTYLKNVDKFATLTDEAYVKQAVALALTKASNEPEFISQMTIFDEPSPIDPTDEWLQAIDSSLDATKAVDYLTQSKAKLADTDYTSQQIETALRSLLDELEASPRALLNLVRWSVSGSKVSPGLFEMIAVLGQEKVESRLQSVIDKLNR